MLSIRANNVNDALRKAVDVMRQIGTEYGKSTWRRIAPRDGLETYEYAEPVATSYSKPWQRVLLCPERDANPFFHLMESLWMLAGRDDARWISQFSSKIGQYAEDDGRFWGAYGKRWTEHFDKGVGYAYLDQLKEIVDLLRREPDTRRAVLTMWDPTYDLNLADSKRDHPCNTHVYFKLRDGGALNMTVCCRSNDIVLGCYGANAVHFSVLQEYVAHALGARVGTYTQISDSWHAYVDNPFVRRALSGDVSFPTYYVSGGGPQLSSLALVNGSVEAWNEDLVRFMSDEWDYSNASYSDIFFHGVAVPMRRAYEVFTSSKGVPGREDIAIRGAVRIKAADWRRACVEWLDRRRKR